MTGPFATAFGEIARGTWRYGPLGRPTQGAGLAPEVDVQARDEKGEAAHADHHGPYFLFSQSEIPVSVGRRRRVLPRDGARSPSRDARHHGIPRLRLALR
ncbi:hypothetical protein GCM10023085_78120 [Actinomadura viridis]